MTPNNRGAVVKRKAELDGTCGFEQVAVDQLDEQIYLRLSASTFAHIQCNVIKSPQPGVLELQLGCACGAGHLGKAAQRHPGLQGNPQISSIHPEAPC